VPIWLDWTAFSSRTWLRRPGSFGGVMSLREGPLKIFTHRWIFATVGASSGFGGSPSLARAGLGLLTATGTATAAAGSCHSGGAG
jgi:hypothetical protein